MTITYSEYIKNKDKYNPPKKTATNKKLPKKAPKKEKEWYEEILNLERFKEVDSVGDFFETVGNTALDTAGNAFQGIFQGAEGLSDFARNRYADAVDTIAKGTDAIGWNSASKTLKSSAKEAREIAKQNETQGMVDAWEHIISGDLSGKKDVNELDGYERIQDKSAIGNTGREGVQSIALNLTTAGLNAASGGTLGLPLIAVSAAGNAEQEALKSGATTDEARTYGLLMGGIEAGTEMLFGGMGKISEGLGFGKGAVDDQLIKQLSKKMKSTALKNISTFAIKSIGEGGEEVLASLGGAFAQKLTYMSEANIKELIKNQDLMKSFIMGTLSSTIMQAPSTITSTAQGRDVNTGLTQVQQEYVNEIAQQRIAEAQKRNERLNGYQQMKIEDRTLEDYQKGRIFDSSRLPMSDDLRKIDLQQSAYKYGINPNSEAVVNIKAMLDNRGVKSRFDADAFKNVNGNAFWSNKNGVREVVFNPNASMDTIVEEIAIHELTHDLMSSKNSKNVINNQKIIDYVSTLDGYKESKAKLEKLYANQTKGMSKQKANALINEEIIADTLGKNIGSQEYIRQLVDSEPSLSKVIYNWIVKTVNNLSNKNGVKKEKLYWENIKNNFEKAYNMDWVGKGKKGDTKYSIGGYKAIEQMEESKYKEHALKAYNKANKMQQSGKYTNEDIRKETKWFQDKNGDWKFEISDSSMSLKESLEDIKPGKEYSVTELFDHKLLTELYPSLKDYKIVFENLDGTKKGSHNIEKKLIRINANMTDYKNLDSISKAIAKKLNMGNYEYAKTMIEGTLLHEIQHAIQEFENFETGKNAALFRKAYYESLGEIEANDTKMRYILERSGKLDRIKKAPESSKALPIHKDLLDKSNLDRYLNKRSETRKFLDNLYDKYGNQIDKIMEKAYNFLSKKGMSNEEIDSLVEKYENEVVREDNRNILRRGATLERTSDSSFSFDNQGRELTKEQQEYFKDSKVRDENGNLATVYHTTTEIGKQFNEFDPVGTDNYRFGNQVVNYYTNSKEMSGSYANQEYKMADTKTFKTIDDVNKWLGEKSAALDKHYVKEVDGKYYLYNNNLPTRHSWDNMQTMFDEVRDKFYENPFYSVDNKPRKLQYEGYVNITNPYVIDAEGNGWSKVIAEVDKESLNKINNLSQEKKEALIELAQESKDRFDIFVGSGQNRQYNDMRYELNALSYDELQQKAKNNGIIKYLSGSSYVEIPYQDFMKKFNELEQKYTSEGRAATTYFEKNYKEITKNSSVEDLLGNVIYNLSKNNFSEESINYNFSKTLTTNDVVNKVIEKNKKGSNYDGVIIKNVVDYGGESDTREPANLYITFASNQFKAIDNENPTDDADIRYSLSDNQGRELSKEQQEYFKDSKVRDENGNLKVLYNGSGNHTVYLPGYMSDESIWGKGIYLTPYKDIAQMYGNDVKETYVNITKPISHNTKMPFEQYNEFYKAIYDGEEAYIEEYDMYDNDFDLLWDATNKGNWADYANELKKYTGYDGIIAEEIDGDKSSSMVIAFQSNQIKNVDNANPTTNEDIRKSQQNEGWQSFLDNNFESRGTKTKLGDIKLPGLQNAIQEEIQTQTQQSLLPIANELKELNKNLNKVMNPSEIAQLAPKDANTTPKLPGVTRNKVGDGKSKYFDNVNNKVGMLNDEQKAAILSDEDVKYYDKVTNKDSLDEAFERLQENGANESLRWFNSKSENADATDVAEGWILLKQYADSGNTEGMVEVAKKLREIGTKAGQTVQAFNILSRLTPEGMVKYAQSELTEAFEQMVKGKSAKWIEENKSKFDLNPNEVQFIMDTMKEVSTMEDGYDKRFKLAQIQKIMTDKLPPTKGAGIKAWMRISMLFNPKTQVRNVAGNAIIAPINAFGDFFASGADKLISKKTGVRTTGTTNLKKYMSGAKQGLYQSYNDFKQGVNTRNIQGNRFEITEGRSFNNDNAIGKALNKVDSMLSFLLDAGDRAFYEASFVNSINNQLVLNNTTEVTDTMVDIATQEALSRTWQDNNKYTKFVLSIRNQLNQVNIGGYGLGDVLIPFAKTPANLTKAIVDYSPVGLIGTINKGIQLNRSLTNGQYSAQAQHEFVQSLGKSVAGTALYILGVALANAGVTTGESDEDKDVANFMKNTMGVNSYSIKIGDKSFTYDWAQPLAAPLSITANLVQKQKEEATLLENITSTLDTAGNLLLEQSFMESINTVLNNNEGIATGIQEAILDLPSRAIPTLFKQIVDMTDSTQRQSFVKGKPIESALNSVKAKLPGLSQTLAPSVDTMGRDIEKYGGKNNLFNVFVNPANVNTENISESAKEIYRVYKETGEKSVMPRVAPYSVTIDNKKINLTASQRTDYQRISGEIIENNVQNLIGMNEYQNMSKNQKAEVIQNVVNYSYNIAQKEVLGKELSDTYARAYEYSQIGDISDFYTFRESIDDTDANTKKVSVRDYLVNSYLNDEQIAYLYGGYYSSDKELSLMLDTGVSMKEFIKFNSEEFTSDYDRNGKAITNSRQNKIINYVNGLNLNLAQRVILIKTEYPSYDRYDNQVFNYINGLNYSAYDKMVMLKKLGFDDYDNEIISRVNSQNISKDEKIKILKEMGFTVRNGRVYS